jgi:uncharacterized delta-60 repeat protein
MHPALAIDGSLDASFGEEGRVLTDFGSGLQFAWDVAVQRDGRIVAAGGVQTNGFALARYRNDGSLDPSFGGDGLVRTGGFQFSRSAAYSIAIHPDGGILVAGSTFNDSITRERFALARYQDDGRLDPGFGGDGRIWTRFAGGSSRASGLAIQADGKIVVAGSASGSFALAQYNPNGSLDASFGGDGKVRTGFGPRSASAHGLAIQADGKIVLAGSGSERFALARYNLDGTLDASFGSDGRVTTRFRSQAVAFDIDVDAVGRILVAGEVCCGAEPPGRRFALARYTPDGGLDATFEGDGRVKTAFRFGYGVATALVIQPDGNIVAAGWAGFGLGTVYFALVRYLAS